MRGRSPLTIAAVRLTVTAVLACLLLGGLAVPVVGTVLGSAPAQNGPSGDRIVDVEYTGQGAVDVDDDASGLVILREQHHVFEISATGPAHERRDVCLSTAAAGTGDDERTLGCDVVQFDAAGTGSTELTVDPWPSAATGNQTLEASLSSTAGDTEFVATADRAVRVLRGDGDVDGDGLTNRREVDRETDLFDPDTDGDGLDDGPEVNDHGTDPLAVDSDGDGLDDGPEVNDHGTDPLAADSDGDGLDDAIEVHTYESSPTAADSDDDGLDDAAELREHGTDPTAKDSDGDGLPDAAEVEEYGTDPTRADSDGDGLDDAAEVNVHGTDPLEADTDGDGLADGAEVSEYDTDPVAEDTDDDGLSDGVEVNAYDSDPNDPDTDGDGTEDGDAVAAGANPAGEGGDGNDGGDLSGVPPVAWALVGGALVAAIVLLARVTEVGPAVGTETAGVRSRLSAVARRARRNGDGAVGGVATDGERSAEATTTTADSVTDEERVVGLLEANDGRVPQSLVVEETAWSKAKVSRVLARMDEAGQISKIQLGRRNLITLPGEEPHVSERDVEE